MTYVRSYLCFVLYNDTEEIKALGATLDELYLEMPFFFFSNFHWLTQVSRHLLINKNFSLTNSILLLVYTTYSVTWQLLYFLLYLLALLTILLEFYYITT